MPKYPSTSKTGTGGRPSNPVKVVVKGQQYRPAKGAGNIVRPPATGGGKMDAKPGSNLPKNATRKPPVLGT
jgi:hypothetical protein